MGKTNQIHVIDSKKSTSSFNIAIIVSCFNQEITQILYDGAIQRLKELEFPLEQITVVWVPGAIEVPITAQRLAETEKYEAIICLGAVIQGDTKHFDYVCQQVSYGCQEVALKYSTPVIFGILTTNDEQQAYARAGGSEGHVGRSSVDTACDLIAVLHQI